MHTHEWLCVAAGTELLSRVSCAGCPVLPGLGAQLELPGAASQQGESALEAQGPGLRDPLPPIVGGARRWPWLGLSAL